MTRLGEHIKLARELRGMTQAELAAKVPISQPGLQKIEAGGTTRKILEIAKALGLTAEQLSNGDVHLQKDPASQPLTGSQGNAGIRHITVWDNEDQLPQDEYIFLPAIDIKLSAGGGSLVWHVDEKGQRQAYTRRWADRMNINPDTAATMVVSGDSMEPRLLDGDSIVVDYSQNGHIIDGKVYAIALEEQLFIKRLFKEVGGGIRIVSDNDNKRIYPDKVVAPEHLHLLRIIGRVVAVSGGV
ncbi:hypothetical protein ACG97_01255 [Vogesella sp. EB]|uniref:XRE family transcriptional regulator n=1 Tax=Vogesella sp. EB TaxID=1526735 RepID=UPI00064D564F|nr:S24 family peptidase [Vogesella sp. EB]KMJ54922.1 hypothetical protein ACG97_01255 [Vogesella sp. EB]